MAEAARLIEKARKNMKDFKTVFCQDGKIVKKSDDTQQYGEKVERIREYIREGHIFQTVLSQRWTIETGQDGFELYKELRS